MASKCANVQIVAMSLDYAQGWEFALLLLSLLLLFTKRATRANRSRHSFKRAKWADCSFHFFKHKCNSLFMWERFALLLFCSCCSLQQEWKENFSLFKRAKERFTLFCQKPLIGTKNQRKSQPWLCCNIVIFPFLRHRFQI